MYNNPFVLSLSHYYYSRVITFRISVNRAGT